MAHSPNGHARTPPPVLDEGYLARLEEQLGAPMVRELMADGLIELNDRLDRLRERARAEDQAEVRRLSHDLAGVAGHLGLSALSQAAADLNRTSRTNPHAALSRLAEPVALTGESSLAALRRRSNAMLARDDAG